MFIQILDILRICLVGLGFYLGYSSGFAGEYNPIAQLQVMIPIVISAVAGISGIEGLLFGKKAAEAKGYEIGSNYQKQSSFALLSYTFGALFVHFAGWGIYSELSVLFIFFFFFTCSATNHLFEAIKHKNYKWQNINRPFILLLLLSGFIYPLYKFFIN